MEQVTAWASFTLAYVIMALWWLMGMALDNWLLTTFILLLPLVVAVRIAWREYLLYKSAP